MAASREEVVCDFSTGVCNYCSCVHVSTNMPLQTAANFFCLSQMPSGLGHESGSLSHLSGSCRNVQKIEWRFNQDVLFCLFCARRTFPFSNWRIRAWKEDTVTLSGLRVSWRETARWVSSSGSAEFFWLTSAFLGILFNLYHSNSQIVVPALPGKALKRQLPFRPDEGLFEESFIEERRLGLEQFINRCVDVVSLEYAGFVCVRLPVAVKHVCLPPMCTPLQNCRSPSGPERALSSHVPAGGNHRPRLHSWKSTTLGLFFGGGGVQV